MDSSVRGYRDQGSGYLIWTGRETNAGSRVFS